MENESFMKIDLIFNRNFHGLSFSFHFTIFWSYLFINHLFAIRILSFSQLTRLVFLLSRHFLVPFVSHPPLRVGDEERDARRVTRRKTRGRDEIRVKKEPDERAARPFPPHSPSAPSGFLTPAVVCHPRSPPVPSVSLRGVW